MRNTLIILALATGLVACQSEGRIYNEYQELSPKLEWLKKDIKEFKVRYKAASLYNQKIPSKSRVIYCSSRA